MLALLATRTRAISKMMATQTMISAMGILAKPRDLVRASPRAMRLPLAAAAAVVAGVLGWRAVAADLFVKLINPLVRQMRWVAVAPRERQERERGPLRCWRAV